MDNYVMHYFSFSLEEAYLSAPSVMSQLFLINKVVS